MSGWKLLDIENICGNALEAVAGAQHRARVFTVDEDKRRKGKENNQHAVGNGQKQNVAFVFVEEAVICFTLAVIFQHLMCVSESFGHIFIGLIGNRTEQDGE